MPAPQVLGKAPPPQGGRGGWSGVALAALVFVGGCQAPTPPQFISAHPDTFLTLLLRGEDGSCWQLLTGGRLFDGESRRGAALRGVAAIQRYCP